MSFGEAVSFSVYEHTGAYRQERLHKILGSNLFFPGNYQILARNHKKYWANSPLAFQAGQVCSHSKMWGKKHTVEAQSLHHVKIGLIEVTHTNKHIQQSVLLRIILYIVRQLAFNTCNLKKKKKKKIPLSLREPVLKNSLDFVWWTTGSNILLRTGAAFMSALISKLPVWIRYNPQP